MATINAAGGSFLNTTRRQYISIVPFENDFFTYTVSSSFTDGSFVTVGTLSEVSGATAANCPAGHVLRENGKKLYPDANPGITTYMVGVYDAETFLSGYINPNSAVFTPMNTDKPTYLPDSDDLGSFAGQPNMGPGINTNGDILTTGNLSVDGYSYFGSTVSVSSFLNVSNPAHFGSTVSVSSFLNVQSTITAGVDVHAKGNVLADAVVAGGTVTFVLRGPGGAAINYSTTTGTWGADLYFDPRIANTVVVGVSAHTAAFSTPTTVNLYCGTSYATSSFVAPIAGANYTLIYNSGPQTGTPNTQFNFGYGIQGGAPQHVGSGLTMISFASDGNNLFQTAVWPPQAL